MYDRWAHEDALEQAEREADAKRAKRVRMRREHRDYDGPVSPVAHWQGRYKLPKTVIRALRRPLGPLLIGGRKKLIAAVNAMTVLIGRFHTSPNKFNRRGCGVGENGGFLLDRRGLSGGGDSPRPPGCEGLTEWGVREATLFLIDIGFIERITPTGTNGMTDRLGRSGVWLKAVKDKLTGRIRAPAIRYRLTALYRALFAETLGREAAIANPPVGEYLNLMGTHADVRTVGVSTGGDAFARLATPEQVVAALKRIGESAFEAAQQSRGALVDDLEVRRKRREARGGW